MSRVVLCSKHPLKAVAYFTVASASISQSGRPVIILKNRDTFVYNPDLRHWALLADSKHPYPGFLSKHAQDSGELTISYGF